MTFVIADTHAQAEYWIRQLGIEGKWVYSWQDTVGLPRTTEIIAVGPLKTRHTHDLIDNLNQRGFTIKFPKSD